MVLVYKRDNAAVLTTSWGNKLCLLRRVVPPRSSFTKEESLGRRFGGCSGRLHFIHEEGNLWQRRPAVPLYLRQRAQRCVRHRHMGCSLTRRWSFGEERLARCRTPLQRVISLLPSLESGSLSRSSGDERSARLKRGRALPLYL